MCKSLSHKGTAIWTNAALLEPLQVCTNQDPYLPSQETSRQAPGERTGGTIIAEWDALERYGGRGVPYPRSPSLHGVRTRVR